MTASKQLEIDISFDAIDDILQALRASGVDVYRDEAIVGSTVKVTMTSFGLGATVRALAACGKRIQAVKLLRTALGTGLHEAMVIFEAITHTGSRVEDTKPPIPSPRPDISQAWEEEQ